MAIDLRKVRQAASKTQRDIADAMGYAQNSGRATLSQIEMRQDWLISSLRSYLTAAGATGYLVVKVGDGEQEQELWFDL